MQVPSFLPLIPPQTSHGGPWGTPVSHPQAKQAGEKPEGEAEKEHAQLGQSRLAAALSMRALTFLWLFLQGPAGRRSSAGSMGPRSPLPHMATC